MASSLSSKGPKRKDPSAVRHWLLQRWSGALLVPFALWFVWGALPKLMRSSLEASLWFQKPSHAVGAFLWTLLIFYHGFLGVQVVIEDYVTSKKAQAFWISGMRIVAFAAAAGACIQIIRFFLGS